MGVAVAKEESDNVLPDSVETVIVDAVLIHPCVRRVLNPVKKNVLGTTILEMTMRFALRTLVEVVSVNRFAVERELDVVVGTVNIELPPTPTTFFTFTLERLVDPTIALIDVLKVTLSATMVAPGCPMSVENVPV